jgi:putative spermidine/putrescine transport system ATP-binding protein
MTIALENINFRYGAAGAAVQDVSLNIAEGELMAVIGPSGCGKSTILKLIAGFLTPASGTISIGGADMGATPPRARDLGIVFQNYALFPHMTLAGNVGYPLGLRGISGAAAAERTKDALGMVGLEHLADRMPRSLSGGQQQRVALARALVFRPRALLLDEPLSALDAAMRGEMRDEIRRLQQHHGIATLHITHDQEEALSMADTVTVMRDGRVLQIGTPKNIYRHPVSHAVAAFVGQANLLAGKALDATHVETALGVVQSLPHDFMKGAPVSVLIRPEGIRISRSAGDIARLTGRVTRDRFFGSLRRFDFRTEGGVTLLVETDDPQATPHTIELPPDAVQVIAPEVSGREEGPQTDHSKTRQHKE